MTYIVSQHVTLHHCDGDIPAVVREVSKDGKRVRLQVTGDKQNRAWLGLHWYPVDSITSAAKPTWKSPF